MIGANVQSAQLHTAVHVGIIKKNLGAYIACLAISPKMEGALGVQPGQVKLV